MTITELLAAVQADITQLQADLNSLATALQGLDITTLQNTLNSLVASVQTTVTALPVQVASQQLQAQP